MNNLVKTVDLTNMGTEDFTRIETDGTTVFICETCKPYDDLFDGFATEAIEKFGYDPEKCFSIGSLPELRDRFIKAFEEVMDVKFVTVFDEF